MLTIATRKFILTLITLGVLFSTLAIADSLPTKPKAIPSLLSAHPKAADTASFFVLEIRHRVFATFQQFDTVRMVTKFPIGDADDMGEVVFFNPHLSITTKGEFLKSSDTLYNPAVLIRVTQKDSVKQESWAFYVSEAPHFRRNDILGFRLVDFKVPDKYITPPMRNEASLATDTASGKKK